MTYVIDRSLYLSPEVVGEPLRSAPLEVKEDPFSLEALVAWLEKQPGETEYCYTSNGHCLVAQYMKTIGVGFFECDPLEWWDMDKSKHKLPRYFDAVAFGGDRYGTFGAALSRARKLLAEREK